MIYFDSAATSLQKPTSVSRATACAMSRLASPGRGSYPSADLAAEVIFSCREEVGALLGEYNPERVVFTSSATHGLNIAIKTLVKPKSTVVISGWEHNAVTRPLHAIDQVSIRVAKAPLFDQEATIQAFARCLSQQAIDVAIFTHVSNVFGYVLPIEELSTMCRRKGVPFVVDASQSAGCIPLNQEALGATFLAMPGHKGLLGPQGTGVLLCGTNVVTPLLEGGTGSGSRCKVMPTELPERLEAGTMNVCGIAGLRAGVRFVADKTVTNIMQHEKNLIFRLGTGISPFTKVFLSNDRQVQSGVLSFQMEGWDCEELALALGQRGFGVRAGLHCAPLAHQTACTLEDGTVRASVSPFTTMREVDLLVCTLRQLYSQRNNEK